MPARAGCELVACGCRCGSDMQTADLVAANARAAVPLSRARAICRLVTRATQRSRCVCSHSRPACRDPRPERRVSWRQEIRAQERASPTSAARSRAVSGWGAACVAFCAGRLPGPAARRGAPWRRRSGMSPLLWTSLMPPRLRPGPACGAATRRAARRRRWGRGPTRWLRPSWTSSFRASPAHPQCTTRPQRQPRRSRHHAPSAAPASGAPRWRTRAASWAERRRQETRTRRLRWPLRSSHAATGASRPPGAPVVCACGAVPGGCGPLRLPGRCARVRAARVVSSLQHASRRARRPRPQPARCAAPPAPDACCDRAACLSRSGRAS
jgi:hypothetical protein